MTATPLDEAITHHRLQAWVLLVGFILITGAAYGVYGAAGTEPSGRFQALRGLGLLLLLWNWFVAQVRPARVPAIPDLGLFIAVFWFALLPYYLWQRQRRRGLAKVGIIMGAHVGAYVITVLVFYAVRS